MELTLNQIDCLNRAKRYKNSNMQTKPFRQLYIRFCKDGYISGADFIAKVKGNEITTLRNTNTKTPIIKYLNLFEGEILGKNKLGAKNGKTN